MVDFSTLTPENINMFAIKHYNNPTCVDEKEFLDDMVNCDMTLEYMVDNYNNSYYGDGWDYTITEYDII